MGARCGTKLEVSVFASTRPGADVAFTHYVAGHRRWPDIMVGNDETPLLPFWAQGVLGLTHNFLPPSHPRVVVERFRAGRGYVETGMTPQRSPAVASEPMRAKTGASVFYTPWGRSHCSPLCKGFGQWLVVTRYRIWTMVTGCY